MTFNIKSQFRSKFVAEYAINRTSEEYQVRSIFGMAISSSIEICKNVRGFPFEKKLLSDIS